MTGGEDALVERIRRAARPGSEVELGIGDDAAIVRLGAGRHVFTSDALVEGVDFLAGERPYWIGRRAAAANLSDLAAMGARPLGCLLTLGLDRRRMPADAARIARGVISRMEEDGASLWGGDLTRSRETFVSICAIGQARRFVTRNGARASDLVFLTGTPGAARRGLRARRGRIGRPPSAIEREFLDPPSRVAFGLALAAKRLATAMIDVSDGVGRDAGRIARGSRVRIVLDRMRWADVRASADDLDLLFTARSAAEPEIRSAARLTGTPISRIGHVESGIGVEWTDGVRRRSIQNLGYDHFAA